MSDIELANTVSGVEYTYEKSVNLILDGTTVTNLKKSSTANVGALQIILKNGAKITNNKSAVDNTYTVTVGAGGNVVPVTDENGNAIPGKFRIVIDNDDVNAATVDIGGVKTVYDDGTEITIPVGAASVTFQSETVSGALYYVSASGSDQNDGLTAETPFATLKKAFTTIGASDGTVKIMGTYTMTNNDGAAHAGHVIIRGNGEGAVIASAASAGVGFGGPVTLKNITYTRGNNAYIATAGQDITFGDGFDTTSTDDWMVFGGGYGASSVNDINVTVNSGTFTGKFNVGAIMAASSGFTVNNDANINVNGGTVKNILLGTTNWGACGATTFAKSVVVQHDGGEITKISAVATGNGSPTKITGSLIVINNNGTEAPTYDATLDAISIGAKYYIDSAKGGYVKPVVDENGNAVAGKFHITVENDETCAAVLQTSEGKMVLKESGEITIPAGNTTITYSDETLAGSVFYVSATGSDDNDGLTVNAPFATLKAAMTALGTETGTIVIVGSYSPTTSDYASHTQNIDIVGYDANASFDSSLAAISFGGPVTFKDITYTRGKNSYILSRGNDITFGEGFKTTSTDDWMVFGMGQGSTVVDDINVTVMSGNFTGKFNVGGIMPASAGLSVNNDANINVLGGSIANIILGSTNWGACGATTFKKNVVVQHDAGSITKITATATGNGSPTAITGSLIVINNNGTAAPTYDATLDSISVGAKYYINSAEGGYVKPVVDENGNAVAGKFHITIDDDNTNSAIILNGETKTTLSESGEVTLEQGTTTITYANYPPNPGTTIPMTWKEMDKGYITLIFDDVRADFPQIFEIVSKEYNLPLCAAVPSNNIKNAPATLHELQDRGGEILSHTKSHLVIKPFVTPWADVEVQLGDSYRILTEEGFNVNGIILAGGTGQIGVTDTEYRGLIELITNKYYKYSDKYGLSTQYWKQRNWFSGRTLDQLKSIVDTHAANKTWEVIYGHDLNEVSAENLRAFCEYLVEQQNLGKIKVVTYKYMHENFGDWASPVDFGDTTYTVEFYGTDKTTYLGKSVTVEGENATAPENLAVADGYTFKGWSASLDNVTNNYTVYAVCTDANGNQVSDTAASVITPPPPPTVFYVDSVNGSDSNDGETATTAFASITKAVTVAEKGIDFEVKIIGSYQLPTTIGGHTGMLTVSGYDSNSEIYTVQSGGYTFAGPITIKDIKFTNGLYAWATSCGHEFIIGENVTVSGNHQIMAGGNNSRVDKKGMYAEIHSGTWNKFGLGPIAASSVHTAEDDAYAYIADGTVNNFIIGGDGWASGHKGVNFKSNVLLKVDGGTIKTIKVSSDNYAPTFGGAVQLIFNNGVKPSNATAVETATAANGVYMVYSAEGGNVDFVYDKDGKSVAGKFNVTIDGEKYAVITNGEKSFLLTQSGEVTLEKGKTEITYKALSDLETTVTITDKDGKHLYYPADEITVNHTGTVSLPDGMKRDGMLFGGWYSNSTYTTAVANGSAVSAGSKLYARWIELDEKDLTVEGVQIRITGIPGLRYISTISHNTRTMLAGLHSENAALDPSGASFNASTDISYGTVVLPTNYLGKAELLKGGKYTYGEKKYGAKTVPAKYTFEVAQDHDKYTAVMTRITDENLDRYYTARPYVTYKDASGTVHTAYGEPYAVSLYDVATVIYENGAANEPEEQRAAILAYLYENVLTKNNGVENTLSNTYRALHNDKKLTVAYLGGSITYGSSAAKGVTDGIVSATGGDISLSYVNRTTTWLKEQFPEAQIEFVNAGISDTATNFGVYRLNDHVMNTNGHDMPDLVFVEFTSNDWTYYDGIEQNHDDLKRQIESLVRNIYKANPYADIVFAFTARSANAASRKDYIEIADHYDITCIDMGIPMQALMTARGASNETSGTYYYTVDNLHPSAAGYAVYFDEIRNTLTRLLIDTPVYYAAKDNRAETMPDQLCRSLWADPTIIPATEFTLSGTAQVTSAAVGANMYGSSATDSSWVAITDSKATFTGTDATAKFEFTGTSFGFVFGMNSSGFNIDYQIDGHGWKNATVDEDLLSFQKYAHTQVIIFEQELAYGKHTVELKFNATSDGKVNVVIGGAVVSGEDNDMDKLVAFSVDDGPRTTTTPMLLDELKKYGAHATFFCVGGNINASTAPVMQRIIAEGSEIGNHGNAWASMANMTAEELMTDFNAVQTKAFDATGVYPRVFRAPGLQVSQTMLQTIPIPIFGGKLGVSDWKSGEEVSVEQRVNAIMANVVDGRIILTHDVEANAEAYSITIPRIYEMGYKIVTISELIKLRGYSAPAGSAEQYWEFP